jgi:hypothetical protein
MSGSKARALDEIPASQFDPVLLPTSSDGEAPTPIPAASPVPDTTLPTGGPNVVLDGPAAVAMSNVSGASQRLSIGQQDGLQNTVTVGRFPATAGNRVALGLGDGLVRFPPLASFNVLQNDWHAGPNAAETIVAGAQGMGDDHVGNAGNDDGNHNLVVIGNGNGGQIDGSGNLVAIGNADGVFISGPLLQGTLPPMDVATPTGGGPADIVAGGVTAYLARPEFAPVSNDAGVTLPRINLVFDSIQITVSNSGNNDGNGNSVALGSINSGSFNGNSNQIGIGNENGVSVSALNPTDAIILGKQVQLSVSGVGNSDGNGNAVAVGSSNTSSNDGNGNTALVGNMNGVAISTDGSSGSPGPGPQATASGAESQTLTDLGTYLDNQIGAALHVVSETTKFDVSGAGNDLNGSFNGNNNNVVIGSDNGTTILISLGDLFPAGGPDFVSESVAISVQNSGNNDGVGNAVQLGSGNGENSSAGQLAAIQPLGTAAASPMLSAGSQSAGFPSWSAQAIDDILEQHIRSMLSGTSQVNVIVESIGITINNSGNNDGNQNSVIAGGQNGGAFNGNNNSLLIGNQDGVSIHV